MKRQGTVRALAALVFLLVLSQLHCLLIPDDQQKGTRVGNIRPKVEITGGAASPDSSGVDYKVLFQWHGTDQDGVVILYEWAVDDTLSDSAWHDTTGFSLLNRFPASTRNYDLDRVDPRNPSDSLRAFSDWHTFFVRAVDNEFAVSRPSMRYFNSRTLAPSSKITFPDLTQQQAPELQKTIRIRWEGEDLDSSRPDRKPIYYEYKRVLIPSSLSLTPVILDSLYHADNLELPDSLTRGGGDRGRWVRVPETVRDLTISGLQESKSFAFAVRAVDEAGAIEPALVRNINFIAFNVTSREARPSVRMTFNDQATHRFPQEGNEWKLQVSANTPLIFDWVGDASEYGSLPGNVKYALDIPDPDDEDNRDPQGIGGWIAWGLYTGNQVPFRFQNAGEHTLWVYMRDISDAPTSEQRCKVSMKVVDFTFENFALMVDDARMGTFPPVQDGVHDRFLNETLLSHLYDLGSVTQKSMFIGANEGGESVTLELDEVARYQNIIWNVEFTGQTQLPGLYKNETLNGLLATYLRAGGRMFLFGGRMVGYLQRGTLGYPKEPTEDPLERAKFPWRFMYMRNSLFSKNINQESQTEAGGMIGAHSLHPAYPDLVLDRAKWKPEQIVDGKYRSGITFWEGTKWQPGEELEKTPGLDSLYATVTWNRTVERGPVESLGSGAISALRYQSTHQDTLRGRQHGRILFFDFQPYYFERNQMKDAGTSAVNWLVKGTDF